MTKTSPADDYKGYAIKGLKTCNGTDGKAFSANIYLHGKKVGEVTQGGHGGPNDYCFWTTATNEDPKLLGEQNRAGVAAAEEVALQWVKDNSGWWDEFITPDLQFAPKPKAGEPWKFVAGKYASGEVLDWFLGAMIETKSLEKDTKSLLRRKWVVRFADGRMLEWKRVATQENGFRAHAAMKHPTAVILNDLPTAEAAGYLFATEEVA